LTVIRLGDLVCDSVSPYTHVASTSSCTAVAEQKNLELWRRAQGVISRVNCLRWQCSLFSDIPRDHFRVADDPLGTFRYSADHIARLLGPTRRNEISAVNGVLSNRRLVKLALAAKRAHSKSSWEERPVSQTRKSNHPYAIKVLGRLISNLLAFLDDTLHRASSGGFPYFTSGFPTSTLFPARSRCNAEVS
jgi:hypothetical protein